MATSLAGFEEELAVRIQRAFSEARHPFVGYEYSVSRDLAVDEIRIFVRALLRGEGSYYYYAQTLTGEQISAAVTIGVLLKDVCELAVRRLCEAAFRAPDPYVTVPEAQVPYNIGLKKVGYNLKDLAAEMQNDVWRRYAELMAQQSGYGPLANATPFPTFKEIFPNEFPPDPPKDRFELLELDLNNTPGFKKKPVDDVSDDVERYKLLDLD